MNYYCKLRFYYIALLIFGFIVYNTVHCSVVLAKETVRLGLVLPSLRESRWQHDLESFQNIADKYDISLLLRIAGNNQEKQNIQIKELVTLGIDALIVVADDINTVAPAIAYAKKNNVFIIAYDRLPQHCDIDAHVTFNNLEIGKLMGEYLATQAPKGDYLLLTGPPTDSASASLLEGAKFFLQPLINQKKIQILDEQSIKAWHPRVAQTITEQLLENERPVAILAPNDDTAGGVIEALTEANLAGKVFVTGQDATASALTRISAGTQGMTVFKNTNLLVQKTMQIVMQHHNNSLQPSATVVNNAFKDVPTHYLPVQLITKKNIQWLLRSAELDSIL